MELARAISELNALAAIIERPPSDDVLLAEDVPTRIAAAIRTVVAALGHGPEVAATQDVATDRSRRDLAAALRNTPAEALREAGYLDRAADMLDATPSVATPADDAGLLDEHEPDEAVVDRCAKAMWQCDEHTYSDRVWSGIPEYAQDLWRDRARVCLITAAASPKAPSVAIGAGEMERLREAIEALGKVRPAFNGMWADGYAGAIHDALRLFPVIPASASIPADVERDDIRRSIIRQLGDDPHADRIILQPNDWDIVLAALAARPSPVERDNDSSGARDAPRA